MCRETIVVEPVNGVAKMSFTFEPLWRAYDAVNLADIVVGARAVVLDLDEPDFELNEGD